ncbi:MAG: nucleotidyltransferase family protein [Candidatus Aenigmarchaeota archaeon]|nr:nucleotidyltransferase family protein [Candidatus Aenigmarchaeota archaeon]
MNVRQAVILCGGKGTRLRPVTYEMPKSLITVQGKSLIEHLLDLFKKHDIRNILLSVGYKKEKIIQYFGSGEKFGVHISYIEETEDNPLGTAGPLKKAKHLIDDTFIVTNGDELKDINLKDMCELHDSNKAQTTIALTKVEDPSQYGVVELNNSRILRFVEKPPREQAPSNLINSGLYILEREIINLIPEGFSMLEKDVFPKLAQDGHLHGYQFSGQWFDTGTFERWENAILNWKGLSSK